LRIDVDRARVRIDIPPHCDVEAWLFSSCAVIGKIETLLDQGIDISRTLFARALARMQEHVLHNGIGPLTVLHNLAEVVLQQAGQLIHLRAEGIIEYGGPERVLQFVTQLS
jgi:hypothetical protein